MKKEDLDNVSKFNVSGNDYRNEKDVINELLGATLGGVAGSTLGAKALMKSGIGKGLGKTAAGAIGGAVGAGAGEALDPTKKPEDKSPLKAAALGGAIGAGVGELSKPGRKDQLVSKITGNGKKKVASNTTNSVQDNIAKNEADKLKFKNDPNAYFGTN